MANETVLFKRGDSATITSTPVTDGQILFDTSGNGKMYLDNGTDRLEMGGAITVDASLSKTSTNAIQNKAVTGNILNSLAEVSAATQQNTIAGALALKEVNSSLTANNNKFYFDYQDGKYGFNTDPNRGADTFSPFSSGVNEIAFGWNGSNYGCGIIKKDGTTLGGTVSATTLNGNYVSLNISTQYKEGTTYKGSITFTALVAGNYKIYENGTVTDKSVSANEVIYTKTMAGNNIPVSVVAM